MLSNRVSAFARQVSQWVIGRRRFAAVVCLCSILAVGLIIVSARSTANRKSTSIRTMTPVTQRLYVRAGALWPQLRWNLRALGDRLERPGKEQLLMTGTLTRAGVPTPAPVLLNIEAPNRMTLTIQSGLQPEVVHFDESESALANLAASQRDLVETLLFNSAESFFFGQASGSITRCLGFRFRLNEGSSGPFYDLYAVTPRVNVTSVTGAKLFHFNSETLVLDAVRYKLERNSRQVDVEVRLTVWRDLNGQKIAHRIERFEDSASVMTLLISSVVFAPGTPGVTP